MTEAILQNIIVDSVILVPVYCSGNHFKFRTLFE